LTNSGNPPDSFGRISGTVFPVGWETQFPDLNKQGLRHKGFRNLKHRGTVDIKPSSIVYKFSSPYPFSLQTLFSTISSGDMADIKDMEEAPFASSGYLLFFRAPDSSQSFPNVSATNRFLELTTDDDLRNFWGAHGNDKDALPAPDIPEPETTSVAPSENRGPEATAMGPKRRFTLKGNTNSYLSRTRHDKTPRTKGSNRYGRKGVRRCENCRKWRQKVRASFCGGCLIENSVNITVRKIPVKSVFYTGFHAVRNCGVRRWKRTGRTH